MSPKRILITGASGGIGLATAEVLLAAGWEVGLLARRADRLAEIAAKHPKAMALVADVTDEGQVDAAFAEFCETGPIDALFNNAGMFGPQTTIDNISLKDWTQVVEVNLTGMFLCARAAFRRMRAQTPQGGRIINNGSISAVTPREGSTCYTTTKHGVTGLTKTLSLDGRPFHIACGQIDIGNARTEMVADLQARRAAEGLPEVPTMDVQDAARAVLHMAELPLDTNVLSMTIMANSMPFVGRG